MHIPDGFISPITYIPFYILDAGLLLYSFRKVKESFNEESLPFLSSLTALSFAVMSLSFPVFGGSSVHITGITVISILFGYWTVFITTSIVLIIQAVMFGEGGITSFPINSIGIGLIGGFCGYITFRVLNGYIGEKQSLFTAGFFSTIASATFIALVLGLQPQLAKDGSGRPLYFPFDLEITIPAVLLPHVLAGVVEGLYTVAVYGIVKKRMRDV